MGQSPKVKRGAGASNHMWSGISGVKAVTALVTIVLALGREAFPPRQHCSPVLLTQGLGGPLVFAHSHGVGCK